MRTSDLHTSPAGSRTGRPLAVREDGPADRGAYNGARRMSINLVFLLGNLTRDPILRHTPSGAAVADMGLAVSESRKNREGEETESVTFIDVVAWGRQAEACAKFLQKGSGVFLEGRLQLSEWTDKEGNKRDRIKVRAERVQFLSKTRPKSGPGDPEGGEE